MRSHRYPTKSWLDLNEFNQIRLDLDLGNKPETDRYHTIPDETQSGQFDVSSESIVGYDFPPPKVVGSASSWAQTWPMHNPSLDYALYKNFHNGIWTFNWKIVKAGDS